MHFSINVRRARLFLCLNLLLFSLQVLESERLQSSAAEVGRYLLSGLRALMDEFPCIGDVRGLGLFVGIEIVTDRRTQQHAPRSVAGRRVGPVCEQ